MSTLDRFVALMAKSLGVKLDPSKAQPHAIGDRLTFFAPVDEAIVAVGALVNVHGIDRSAVSVVWLDDEAIEVPADVATEAHIGVSISALAARLASLKSATR